RQRRRARPPQRPGRPGRPVFTPDRQPDARSQLTRHPARALMSKIDLAYGRHGLSVDLRLPADVIEPRFVPGLADEVGAIRQALREPTHGPPLREVVPRGASVGISVCDVTRPFP